MCIYKCFPYKIWIILKLLKKLIYYFILCHYIVSEKKCALFKYVTNNCSIIAYLFLMFPVLYIIYM